ncbi:tight adherence protein B [Actinacidiphila yanglinensis]|uniref:Tight adherence protein B n=1 Tax=Actinacidiphila yanglinensis TaxID=310779 RepID=A0A1H6E9P5_9ACTN|nr:tight adherence protein B [Actinacidiphila yanglinensis]
MVTWSAVPLVAGAAGVPLVRGALRTRAERAAAERTSAAVSALCGTVAGDLRAGRPPHAALTEAVQSAGWPASPELSRIAGLLLSAARFGGDVPGALRSAARGGPGAHGLGAVAACWQVAVDGGAGLAAALDRVAAALRAEEDQRDDLRAQLAGPRSTAVLLALLPVFGLVLGTALGAHPALVLLHTPAGMACLASGVLLEWAGLAWTARIIRAAEGGPPPGSEGGPGCANGRPDGTASSSTRSVPEPVGEGRRS